MPTRPIDPHARPADAAMPVASSPNERECDELIAHALALGMDEQRAKQPPDQVPTGAEQRDLGVKLGPYSAACLELTREAYRCARAATRLSELAACHSTPSNSTSKSSVAPGGIAPPAPRAP